MSKPLLTDKALFDGLIMHNHEWAGNLPEIVLILVNPCPSSKELDATFEGMVSLKSKIQYLVLAGLFFAALIGFSPFQLMVGRYQVSPFWCLSIPIPGILLLLVLNKASFNTSQLSKRLPLPLLVGFLIASIHFTIFFVLFDSTPSVCSSSSLLSAFPLAPTYLLIVVPIVPDLLEIIIDLLRINSDLFAVFASSCFYGLAGSLLVSSKITHRLIGLTLAGISVLAGFFSILVAIGTGCGA